VVLKTRPLVSDVKAVPSQNGQIILVDDWTMATDPSLFQCLLAGKLTFLWLPNELRIDVAGRAKVEAPVHCAATSIRVELRRFGEVKELLGDYPRITGIMCERKSKTVP
jgi:hypothetical protein